jgi:hypothetical protein
MTFALPPEPLDKKAFAAGYSVLLDYFARTQDDSTIAFVFSTLKKLDPNLSRRQWEFIVQKSLVSFTFMPRLNDLLGLIYKRDFSGMPSLPDIDPRYADSYQQNIYEQAKQAQAKWLASTPVRLLIGNYGSAQFLPGQDSQSDEYVFDEIPDVDVFAAMCPTQMWRAELLQSKLNKRQMQELNEDIERLGLTGLDSQCLPPGQVVNELKSSLPSLFSNKSNLDALRAYYEAFPQLKSSNATPLLPSGNQPAPASWH